jgi:hypothetical protein
MKGFALLMHADLSVLTPVCTKSVLMFIICALCVHVELVLNSLTFYIYLINSKNNRFRHTGTKLEIDMAA